MKQKSYWLEPGSVLNQRYRIDKVLEEGGFGIVYRGYDLTLNMKVSIKEYFPREMADRIKETKEILPYKGEAEQMYQKGLEKFLAEARILAKCTQIENVVIVRDFFYANQTAYIIMEYVEGITVRNYVEQYGKMEAEEVFAYMEPILQSLIQIHHTGLIHRDISPENIIITKEKKVYLIDFGSTRPYSGDTYQTMTVFFKRGYAAEEQYREKGEQGPWTDVYSLCATMYFMLTGIVPVESAQRNVRDTLEPLMHCRDVQLDHHRKKVIMKGLAVKHQKRYRDVSQLYQALYGPLSFRKILGLSGKKVAIVAGLLIVVAGLGGMVLQSADRHQQTEERSDLREISVSTPAVTEAVQTTAPLQRYQIPDVVGKSLAKAKKAIKEQGDTKLSIVVEKKYSSHVSKGKVIRQSIAGGTEYVAGDRTEIILVVSRGKDVGEKMDTPEPTVKKKTTPAPKTEPKTNEKKKNSSDSYAGDLPF